MKRLITLPETAVILGVTTARAYGLARLGWLPVVKVGRQIRVDADKLSEWIDNGGQSFENGWKKH